MPNKAVIAYVFDKPDDLNGVRMVAAVSKQLFQKVEESDAAPLLEGVTNLQVHSAIGDAADTIAFFVKNGELPTDIPEESNFAKHARRELELIETDREMVECLVRTAQAFSTYGHSGGSHSVAVEWLHDLLHFKPLSPLTNDPDEWMHVAEEMAGSPNVWQSRRDPEMFSNDGGKTYYWVNDEDRVIQTSATKGE